MELTYQRQGDYLFPNLEIESSVTEPIGRFGMQRKAYLKEHHPGWYQSMLLTGRLDGHLLEIDRSANARMELLTNQMAEREDVTEALKETNQLEWVQRMNNIRSRAEEIVLTELIYN